MSTDQQRVPHYLAGHAALHRLNPRAAALRWFSEAKYGLFLHFGLYSLLGRHEWVQLRERVPVAEYAELAHQFRAEHFDAESIAAFAQDCGDWRHPHAPNNDQWGGRARPEYDPPEPSYAYGSAHQLDRYLDFVTAQIRELLTGYGPIAGIWLDGIAVPEHVSAWKRPAPLRRS